MLFDHKLKCDELESLCYNNACWYMDTFEPELKECILQHHESFEANNHEEEDRHLEDTVISALKEMFPNDQESVAYTK